MFTEIEFQINAQHREAELQAEAATRRLLRSSEPRADEPERVVRRLQTVLRRLAGAPTFA